MFVADLTDFFLWDPSQDGIELEVFSARQQVVYGVKLGTVSHILVHLIDLCCYTEHSRRQKAKVFNSLTVTFFLNHI